MKRLILIILLLNGAMAYSLGQTPSDSITMTKVSFGYKFSQGGKSLMTMNQLTTALEPNALALSQFKAAQSTRVLGTVIGAAGGFLIGWPLGTAIGGGEPNWTYAAVGVGLVIITIPINQSYFRQVRQSVDTFNSGLSQGSWYNNGELRFSVSGQRAGLKYTF